MTDWVNIKFIICFFTTHDPEEIPPPINKDYGDKSPGTVCVRCGRMFIKKEPPKIATRIDRAKEFYEKHCRYEHFTNSPSGVACPFPPGPYCNPPSFSEYAYEKRFKRYLASNKTAD